MSKLNIFQIGEGAILELDEDNGVDVTQSQTPSTSGAIGKVATFLGLNNDVRLNKWKDRFLVRVESDNIGFKMKNLLPLKDDYNNILSALHRTIEKTSEDRSRREKTIASEFPTDRFEQPPATSAAAAKTDPFAERIMLGQGSLPLATEAQAKNGALPDLLQRSISAPSTVQRNDGREVQTSDQHLLSNLKNDLGGKEFPCLTDSSLKDSSNHAVITRSISDSALLGQFSARTSDQIIDSSNATRSDTATSSTPEPHTHQTLDSLDQGTQTQTVSKHSSKYAIKSSQAQGGLSKAVSSQSHLKRRKSNVTFSNTVEEFYTTTQSSFTFVRSLFKKSSSEKQKTEAIKQIPEKASSAGVVDSAIRRQPLKSILKVHSYPNYGRKVEVMETSIDAMLPMADSSPEQWLYYESALQHYVAYKQYEKEKKVKFLHRRKETIKDKIEEEIRILQNSMVETQAFICEEVKQTEKYGMVDTLKSILVVGPYSARKRPTYSEDSLVAKQLDNVPYYTPWFTYAVTIFQIISLCLLMSFGDIDTIGIAPSVQLKPNILTFSGLATADHWEIKNPWIGPTLQFLIQAGAVYAPCMRNDIHIFSMYSKKYDGMMGIPLGCCEVKSRNTAGTTSQEECYNWTLGVGEWKSGILCSMRPPNMIQIPHVIKPCCYGLQGQCQMVTLEHCVFLEGHFSQSGPEEHCSQVNCLSSVCGFGGLSRDNNKPFQPRYSNQFWRLWLAIIIHPGVLQCIFLLLLHLVVCRQLEHMAGWLRVGLIYINSGALGFLTAASVTPYLPHMGATCSLFGLLAVLYVELVQSWKLVLHPWKEIAKLLSLTLCFLLMGTLPYVDNYGLLASFLYGGLLGIVLLPYITFGKWHTWTKRVLVIVCLLIFLFMVLMSLLVFFDIQTVAESCTSACKYFNCVPYADKLCDIPNLW